MPDRTGSPLAFVNAVALTLATVLTGAWHAGGHGHGHEATAANASHCTVAHEAEAAAPTSHEAVGGAAALHDHTCLACLLGRATTTAGGKAPSARPLDLPSAAEWPEGAQRAEGGERRQRTARGPPQG